MRRDLEAARGMVRLLQFLLQGPARVDDAAEGTGTRSGTHPPVVMHAGAGRGASGEVDAATVVLLGCGSGQRHTCPRALLALCERQGLVARSGALWRLLPPARAALRRLLAGPDHAYLGQHVPLQRETRQLGAVRVPVLVNAHASPLAQLARLKARDGSGWFPPEAIRAGERLFADFTFGALQPRVTSTLEPRLASRAGGMADVAEMSDSVADARARVSRAAEALGPELAGVALDVCCFEKGLERVEQERQWPARSAKLMLRTALLALARHYDDGVKRAVPTPRGSG